MRCNQVRGFMEEWLDGQLPEKERTGFERHLRGCETCAHHLEQRRQLGEALKRTLREQGAGLRFKAPDPARLADALPTPRPLLSSLFPVRTLLALAAALLLALLFLFRPWAASKHSTEARPALTGVITVRDSLNTADETFISGRADGFSYVIHMQVSGVRIDDHT